MDNLETGNVEDRALEAGVLVAADDQRIDILLAHGGANVVVAALDFGWTGQKKFLENLHLAVGTWQAVPAVCYLRPPPAMRPAKC